MQGGKPMKNKQWFSALSGLTYLTQLGISIATPIVLMMLLANFLVNKGYVGSWAYFMFVILGLGASAMSFYSYIKYVLNKSKKTKSNNEQTIPDELKGKLL